MDIHEYQAKELLARFGVPVAKGGLAYSPEQAAYRAHELGGSAWAIKAQVHAGGRGKAGGIKLCRSEDEVLEAANALLGKRLVTHQTGPRGKGVYRLYVEAAVQAKSELYLGFVLDRQSERIMVVASTAGGMEVEDIAKLKPETIFRESIDPAMGMQAFHAREIAFGLGLAPGLVAEASKAIMGCYRAMQELDATMLEINPLVVTEEGHLLALDAKMTFDDNALFRHSNVAELRDKSQEDPRETRAADRGLAYVGLDGQIGCIVNGAGLAMATMDMIKLAGGEPANFLDVGGAASADTVADGLRIILADPNVEAILINIFGGIVRCDLVAQGVVEGARRVGVKVPVVVRIEGNRAEEGRRILGDAPFSMEAAKDMAEAGAKAVAAAGRSGR
jgi:malate-CoA ligase subunit beta